MTDTAVREFCCKVFSYKERALAVLFFILEAISLVLDQYGGSHLVVLAASFLLSAVVFLIMACNFTKSRSEVLNERNVIELVFSIVQFIVTYTYFVFAILGVKLKLKASIFPLVLAVTALALAFKSNEQGTDSSPNEIQLITSNASTVVVEAENTNSFASSMQDVSSNTPTAVDEEDATDSRALLLHVASSNALAESPPRSALAVGNDESTDLEAPRVKLELKASIFPLALAVTALALAFKSNEQGTDSSPNEIQLITSNASTVVVEAENTNSFASSMQDVSSNTPTAVDEEDATDSRALLLHVASSNALAESPPRSALAVGNDESTALEAPLISSNSSMMSDGETTSPTISEATTPRGWYDVDEGTGWTDVDEGTGCTELDEGTWRIDADDSIINYSRPHMRSAQSNLWQSTKLFSKYITITDLEKELVVPIRAMKHFSIPEGKDFVDLPVKDLKGKLWNFRLTIHPMTALTDGWLAFVQATDLQPGNIVTFYKQQEENVGEQYRVEVDS